ncbi:MULTISPECIES: hypothetical protein [Micromonospora]|uniref:hypothetical protein n=1 Tax=Micromonospora TaxID=1873 RepID=UPI000DFA5F25|nr:hypothetical protein [Micromonospora provocatoris]RBI99094.1 hypothetical protein DRA43_24390 [Micromonospora provocatoris]
MPAKRNPKKSRKQSSPQVTPPNLGALTVTPPAVVLPTEPLAPAVSPDPVSPVVAAPTVSPVITAGVPAVDAGSVSLPESPETPVLPGASATPPRSGPPSGRQARLGGRSQRAGQTRFYAFRRS